MRNGHCSACGYTKRFDNPVADAVRHKKAHMKAFPDLDAASIAALDLVISVVRRAQKRDTTKAKGGVE